jgi:hypothetical protein
MMWPPVNIVISRISWPLSSGWEAILICHWWKMMPVNTLLLKTVKKVKFPILVCCLSWFPAHCPAVCNFQVVWDQLRFNWSCRICLLFCGRLLKNSLWLDIVQHTIAESSSFSVPLSCNYLTLTQLWGVMWQNYNFTASNPSNMTTNTHKLLVGTDIITHTVGSCIVVQRLSFWNIQILLKWFLLWIAIF